MYSPSIPRLVPIPRFLIENERLFLSLMSMETWNSLSSESRKELLKLLPEESDISKEEIVRRLLTRKNFRFGKYVTSGFPLITEYQARDEAMPVFRGGG